MTVTEPGRGPRARAVPRMRPDRAPGTTTAPGLPDDAGGPRVVWEVVRPVGVRTSRLVTVGVARCHRCRLVVAELDLDIPATPGLRPRLRWHRRNRTCTCASTSLPLVHRVPPPVQQRVREVLRRAGGLQPWESIDTRTPPELTV